MRPWIKFYPADWLQGTTREELTEEERGVYVDLLALAGSGRYDGIVAAGEREGGYIGYSVKRFCGLLNRDVNNFLDILRKLERMEKIKIHESTLNDVTCYWLEITNWYKYQSESWRVKKYHRKRNKTITKSKKLQIDTDPISSEQTRKAISEHLTPEQNILQDTGKEIKTAELVKETIAYFNKILETAYSYKNKTINGYINARLEEGHTVDELKKVIDKKTAQWRNDPKMCKYLRPNTLFNSEKFEGYLNEPDVQKEESWQD